MTLSFGRYYVEINRGGSFQPQTSHGITQNSIIMLKTVYPSYEDQTTVKNAAAPTFCIQNIKKRVIFFSHMSHKIAQFIGFLEMILIWPPSPHPFLQ